MGTPFTTEEPTRRPTRPITVDPTAAAKPTRRPTSGTYLTPEPSRTYLTPEPTKKAPKTKAPKPTKAPKTKKPKPTKAPKTSKPTKAPKTKAPKTKKPTKAPKTKKPKPTRDTSTYLTPEPTAASGWGAPNPSTQVNNQEILAVEVNGVTESSFTGYSMQAEIVGMSVVGLVLFVVAYSKLCKA